jgi:hypothetical protein
MAGMSSEPFSTLRLSNTGDLGMPATAREGERQRQKAGQEPRQAPPSGPGSAQQAAESPGGSAERAALSKGTAQAAARLGAQLARGATEMGSSFPALTPSFLPEPFQMFVAWYMEMIWQMWLAHTAFWMNYFENTEQFAEERRKLYAQTYDQAKSNPAAALNPADFVEKYKQWMAAAASRSAAGMPFPPPFMGPPGTPFPWSAPSAPAAEE